MNCLLLTDKELATAHISNEAQIQHINSVLNTEVGDNIKIGVYHGLLGYATIAKKSAQGIELTDIVLDTPPPPKLNLTVVLALPRPKVLRRLIMDMTALGVAHIIIVNSYRSEKSYWQSPLLARLDEFIHEGLQQAVDTIPPKISLKKRFKPFVEDELPALLQGGMGVVAHPYASMSLKDYFGQYQQQSSKPNKTDEPIKPILPTLLCVGAEGGWIDYEVELLSAHGCQAVNMGSRILRTESAVNVLVGQWLV